MRKEVIFALILGVLLGGVILYGIDLANKAALLSPKTEPTENTSQTNVAPQTEPSLIITTPEDHAVVFEDTLPISGSTKPGSTVVITSENDEQIVEADEKGNFSASFDLVGGENLINIASFLSDAPVASASIDVIYTTSKID